jgi:protein-tyrosine phosphatase
MPDHGSMATDGPYRVCFVCSGNICRSPMAEVVLRELADGAGIGHLLEVDSAGTGDWHIGERADRRALSVLRGHGYGGDEHRARQFDPHWFTQRDLVIALDRGHLRTLRSWAANEVQRDQIRLLRSFDPRLGLNPPASALDVQDPFYDGAAAFELVLGQIEAGCAGLLDRVRNDLQDLPVSY